MIFILKKIKTKTMGNTPMSRDELLAIYNSITTRLDNDNLIMLKINDESNVKELYKLIGREYRCEISPIFNDYGEIRSYSFIVYPKSDMGSKAKRD